MPNSYRKHPSALMAVAVAISLLCAPLPARAQPVVPELFRPVAAARPGEGEVRSQRAVLQLDLSRPRGPMRVVFNPFADVRVPVALTGATEPDGSIAWRGSHVNDPFSHVLLVWSGGYLNGTALLDGTGYAITDDGTGALLVTQVAEEGPFPMNDQPTPAEPGPPRDAETPGAQAEVTAEIDILVALTDDVLDGVFGGNEATAAAWAVTRVVEFNDALANSAVLARGRLAGVVFVDYAESHSDSDPNTDIYTDLKRLTFVAGEVCGLPEGPVVCDPSGHLDGIHQLRDAHGADVVALVVSDQVDGAGIGWLTCPPGGQCLSKYLFSVSRFNAASSSLTLSHEVGHNLGLRHDLANDTNPPATYARGYRVAGKFATVMSYPCTINPSGECTDQSVPRILHFSNPNVSVGGDPTGIPIGQPGEAHAAFHIDAIAATVAAARDAVTSPPVGLVDPGAGLWHLRDELGVVSSFYFGVPGDYPFVGDWNCDGIDTPGLYRQTDGFVYLRNSNDFGVAEISFFFGLPGDIPIAGDFNGDGCDTLGIYRPSEGQVYISDALGTDGGYFVADYNYYFGLPGDKPFVGDFNGDQTDTIGLHRESSGFVYFRNTHTIGIADNSFFFGLPGDRLVAGDWGIIDNIDTPAVFRPTTTTFYFRHTNTQGNADSQFTWGSSTWLPIAGTFAP